MHRWCLGALVLLFLAPALHAGPYYTYLYVAKRDGNIKIWRTKDGARVSTTPAADVDVVQGDSVWVHSDQDWANDVDIKWTNASAQPKSNFVGHAYTYNRFEDFLGSHPGPMSHVHLADVTGVEIDHELNFEFWWSYLQSNPPPDPLATYNVIGGLCAELPGYFISETASGAPFTGVCEVIGEGGLSLENAQVPSLNQPAILWLTTVLILISGVALWRRHARGVRPAGSP